MKPEEIIDHHTGRLGVSNSSPPHCDPTIDRYDVLYVVRGDTVIGVVPVDTRGCSQ